MTFLEAITELCRQLDIDYSDIANNASVSLTDLKAWLNLGAKRAWDYKLWDFTEGSEVFTVDASAISDGYIDYPSDFQSGSINDIVSSGQEDPYTKIRYKDYVKWRKQNSTDDSLLFTEYKRFLFINPTTISVGDTIDLYGKLKAATLVNDADLLPFSDDVDNEEYSGNQAVVLLAKAEALYSNKYKRSKDARTEEQRAFEILNLLWQPFAESEALQQSQDNPMFDTPDYFASTGTGVQNTGNF